MIKLYFAGPLFNVAEREFNNILTHRIEEIGYNVFLPQRDGAENTEGYLHKTKEEKRKQMFYLDRDRIFDSDVFLFVLDGRVPDEGACVELGMAYTDKTINNKKREIIGLHTDSRAAFIGGKLNPMIGMAFDIILDSFDDVIDYLVRIRNGTST